MAEIVNIAYTGQGAEIQMYSSKDDALITNSFIYTQFGDPNDNIEFFISDANGNLLDKVYNATEYIPSPGINPTTGLFRSLTLDPQKDLSSRGYTRGNLNIQYNFLRNLFNSSYGNFYWIKEISTSRTEIKLSSQNISNTDILNGFNQYQAYVASLNYFNDFYLNFGNNQHIIAVNVAYTEDADGVYLLIKLYEPLPSDYDVKDQLWIVEKIAESVAYNVDIQIEASSVVEQNVLRGPNYNVHINQQVGQSTPYYSYTNLFNTPISSSFQKIMSYYQDRAVNINVDYSNFSNFIHFSSATSRIENFATKVGKIETYNSQINSQLAISGGISNPAVSSSIIILQNYIDDIITNYDTYEYYLYYASSSYAWPKSNSTQPYSLYSVTSSQAINWLGSTSIVPTATTHSILFSASYYDATNKDLLTNTIPQYILDDSTNAPYLSFVNMIGQQFDNIWIYYKDVTNRFDATNNPNTGISPDIVADALMGLGSTLYTNTNISDNLYYSLFGINEDGSLLPPTGSENISLYVTSSLTTLSANDTQKEIYKRIYHNIPYLYKTKGTRNSIDALINIFGIPKSILTVNEFGGYNRSSVDGIDEIYNNKITGSTSVLEISASVLSPDTTIQYYNNNHRLNSKNIEVGFSPADEINSKITSSLGYFSIDQYIGNPTYQYSGSYPALDQYRSSFFSGYNYYHNIYEYIRLLKYYNNSLFKMVQDFVPARANLSEGLIVKSHMLERNKYERHEPAIDISMNYSESIETITISGTDPDEIKFSTTNNSYSQYTLIPGSNPSGSLQTNLINQNNVYGPIPVINNYAWEKYTGEFGGSEITASYNNFSQEESSSMSGANTVPCFTYSGSVTGTLTISYTGCDNMPYTLSIATLPLVYQQVSVCAKIGSFTVTPGFESYFSNIGQCGRMIPTPVFSTYNPGAIINNATNAVLSTKLIEAEYSYGIDTPVNFNNIVSQSKCENCYRVDCLSYNLYNSDSVSASYSYQGCDNSYNSGYIGVSGSTILCAKPGTIITASLTTASVLDNCGTAYSSTPYGGCYSTSIYNQGTSSFIYNWIDCDGTAGSASIHASTISSPRCIRRGSMGYLLVLSPPTYSIIEYYECGVYSNSPSCYSYTGSWTATGGGETGSYIDCNTGNTVIQIFPDGVLTTMSTRCAQSGSFIIRGTSGVVVPFVGSFYNNLCANAGTVIPYPNSSFCTYVSAADINPTPYWYINYKKCNGEVVNLSGSSLGVGYIIDDCVRYNTFKHSPDITTVYTSSAICGYYGVPSVYTGSRQYAEVQDYNYNRTSTVNSRYLGARYGKLDSDIESNISWSFAASYAETDYYVDYTGLFTNVESSSYFPDQMIAKMSYMADLSGGLQELNLQNNNWVYFQNMYKPGDIATIKQFNATQYSNQKYLDKGLTIVESGWSYPPYWYRNPSDSSECYSIALGGTSATLSSSYASITATNTIADGIDNQLYYINGIRPDSSTTSSAYVMIPSGAAAAGVPRWAYNYNVCLWSPSQFETTIDGGNNLNYYFNNIDGSSPSHRYLTGSYYKVPYDGIYKISASFNFSAYTTIYGIAYRGLTTSPAIYLGLVKNPNTSSGYIDGGTPIGPVGYQAWTAGTQPSGDYTISTEFDVPLYSGEEIYYIITIGDYIQNELSILGNNWNISFQMIPSEGTYCLDPRTTTHTLFDSSSYVTGSDILPLTSVMSSYFTSSVYYIPSDDDPTHLSSYYNLFGDINYSTEIENGDYITMYYTGSSIGYPSLSPVYPMRFRILDVIYSGSQTSLQVYPNIPANISTGSLNDFYKIVFTKRVPDETIITLQGKKRPGQTSYGFVVPENLNPNIAKNINSLQSTIQSQILNY